VREERQDALEVPPVELLERRRVGRREQLFVGSGEQADHTPDLAREPNL
jgi:hypothetical protein